MFVFSLIMHHVNDMKKSTRARKYDATTWIITLLIIVSHRNKLQSSAHGAILLCNYNPVHISVSMKYINVFLS